MIFGILWLFISKILISSIKLILLKSKSKRIISVEYNLMHDVNCSLVETIP